MESSSDRRGDERTTKNVVFAALSDSTRRRILRALDTNDGEMAVSDLDRALSASDVAAGDGSRRHHLLVSLVHVHLPKLRAAGLVEWDGDTVSLSDAATVLPLSRPLDGGLLYGSFTDHRRQV